MVSYVQRREKCRADGLWFLPAFGQRCRREVGSIKEGGGVDGRNGLALPLLQRARYRVAQLWSRQFRLRRRCRPVAEVGWCQSWCGSAPLVRVQRKQSVEQCYQIISCCGEYLWERHRWTRLKWAVAVQANHVWPHILIRRARHLGDENENLPEITNCSWI